jgi:multidrug efflux system outer membrane protein
VLAQLMAQARAGVRVAGPELAAARLAEAEAQLKAARAGLLPRLGVGGSATTTSPASGPDVRSGVLSADLTAPIDINGAITARTRAAAAQTEVARAERDQAIIAALRTTGQLYAAVRTAQAQRAAALRSLEAAQDSLSLANARQTAGLDSGLAVAQATQARDTAAARLPGLAQAETRARLGLELLLGRNPGALASDLGAPAPAPVLNARDVLDAPAAVLARRPDVRAARARLEAAGFDPSAARADRWPSLTLSALVSQTDANVGAAGGLATLGLSLAGTLFDFGRLSALADAAGARVDAAAITWRDTLLTAVSQTETEAGRLARAAAARAGEADALASAREEARLARARYTSGLTSFRDVVAADSAVYAAESRLAAAQGEEADASFALAAAAARI